MIAVLLLGGPGLSKAAPTFGPTNTCPTISYGSGEFILAGYHGAIAQSGFIGPPILTASRHDAGSGFELTLRGELGRQYQLQALTVLGGTNGSTVRTFALVQPTTNIVDTTATHIDRRVYREVSP